MNEKSKIVKVHPKPVRKVKCVKCGELLAKFFPYSSFSDTQLDELEKYVLCTKCGANKKVV